MEEEEEEVEASDAAAAVDDDVNDVRVKVESISMITVTEKKKMLT